uniref:Secreted protein n=1 Tax=Ixodes ricinus TaxID=34613 RepID=A0A6B0U307_IXORI
MAILHFFFLQFIVSLFPQLPFRCISSRMYACLAVCQPRNASNVLASGAIRLPEKQRAAVLHSLYRVSPPWELDTEKQCSYTITSDFQGDVWTV